MGTAWCRERVEQAQNSKSPVDRILIRCSKVINSAHSGPHDKVTDDFVYKGTRGGHVGHAAPVAVHVPPPRANRARRGSSGWQACTLRVPDSDGAEERQVAPIPPPRKRRKRRINSLEILNTQLQMLRQPGFVHKDLAQSENLLKYEYLTQQAGDGWRPVSSPSIMTEEPEEHKKENGFHKTRHNLFLKASENKPGKIKREGESGVAIPRALLTSVEKLKNENTKKSEQKIKVKNFSTVSLPNYNELVKPGGKVTGDAENSDDRAQNQSGRTNPFLRNSSVPSLTSEGAGSILSSLSEATIHRLEAYMKRCRSFGSLKPQQILEKLEEFDKNRDRESESEDSWAGLDDWDLGVIEYWDPETSGVPPLEPKSKLSARKGAVFAVGPPEDKPEVESTPQAEEEEEEQVLDKVPPEDWFVNPAKCSTPPPTPEIGKDAEPEKTEADDDPHSSLLKILQKYHGEGAGEQEQDAVGPPTISVTASTPDEGPLTVPVPPRRRSRGDILFKLKERSHSLRPDMPMLEVPKEPKSRSLSISYEMVSTFPELDEIRMKYSPEDALNGLNMKLLHRDLPEDAFDLFITRKRPSLRQSLSDFLGFERDVQSSRRSSSEDEEDRRGSEGGPTITLLPADEGDAETDRKTPPPPPLPLSPPPPLNKSLSFETVLTSPSLVKNSDQYLSE